MIAEADPIEVFRLFTHLNNPKLIKSNHIHTDKKQINVHQSLCNNMVYNESHKNKTNNLMIHKNKPD